MNVNKTAAWTASIVVAATLLAGLWLSGSPTVERERLVDEQRVAALQQLASVISFYHEASGELPASLDVLVDGRNLLFLPRDPVSDAPYEYLPGDAEAYELCASFDAASPDYEPAGFWRHTAGRHCFRLSPGYGNN